MNKKSIEGFGKRLKAVRKSLGHKQKEFAKRLNISVTTLSDIETGKSHPRFNFFVNIAYEYKINLYYLLFGEGEMFYNPRQEGDETVVEDFLASIDSTDEREFFKCFLNSRLVRYHSLNNFREYYLEKEKQIKQDMKKTLK
ncbi:MAG: helix-turn-helix transcriptional regulator [Candidatus Aminicenantes bacterium]|nr:helix-turn-helix transcriptional regulator [Candidatus Aminicenantes bacterium]